MRALLDVNFLIALLDTNHTSYRLATTWFAQHAAEGWASTPITENGCVRIMSHPGYAGRHSVLEIVSRLRAAVADDVHEFWPDSLSSLDERVIDTSRVHGPRQLTDAYLLALAVHHSGRLVTFDKAIALDAVRGAKPANLLAL